MIYHDIQQNTNEWLSLRRGKFTSSMFSDLFMGKSTAGYTKAISKVVFERLTGESPESFKSDYMRRGNQLESEALEVYESISFNNVTNGGFFELNEWIGASPDGLISTDGQVQIKCPAFNTMINYLLKEELPPEYNKQVYGEMLVTGRKWCDFFAYHPKLKPVIIRIERDESAISEIKRELDLAIEKAKSIIEKLA